MNKLNIIKRDILKNNEKEKEMVEE